MSNQNSGKSTGGNPTAITTAELQAIDNFDNSSGQDARRWWSKIELALGKMEGQNEYSKTFIRLVDVKLSGDAARWADDVATITNIIEKQDPCEDDVAEFKRLFLERFRKGRPRTGNIYRELEDLKQEANESLEDYYGRSAKLVRQVCRDGTESGIARTVPIAEATWIQSVIRGFTKGMEDRWIGFHIGDEEHDSLENAYLSAKEHIRQLKRQQERVKEWEREGLQAPEYMPSRYGAYGTYASYLQTQQTLKTNVNQVTKISNDVRQQQGYTNEAGINRYSQGPSARAPMAHQSQFYQKPLQTPYIIHPQPVGQNQSQQQINSSNYPAPQQYQYPRSMGQSNNTRSSGVTKVPQIQDVSASKNPYVNGSLMYYRNGGTPLCVNCGELGHISKICVGIPLEMWEREALKAMVFGEAYQTSRSARLYRGGIPLSDEEQIEEDTKQYALAGYDTNAEKQEDIGVRLASLDMGRNEIASRAANPDEGEGPYKKVSIQELLNKRKERSDESSGDLPTRKKTQRGVKEEPRKAGKSKSEKKNKRTQRKQLRMIRGMIDKERFNLAKALSQTPCPISYLQYFQDSPHARREMSKINSLTSEMLAAMFGDPSPAARNGKIKENNVAAESLLYRPHLGVNGAFMVSAIISGLKPGDGSFSTNRVCIDAGSEVDLATPSTIERTGGDVIDIKDTPWPRLSIKTSSGDSVGIIAIARIRVTIKGVERIVYTCVIPNHCSKGTGYDLLLGVPWLFAVKGSINVSMGTISMSDNSGERIIINTGKITPPNFKVMFETCGVENAPTSDEDTSMAEDDTEDDTSDEGESSDKSSDDWKRTHVYGRSNRLTLEDENQNPIARVRYVTPEDYLFLYREDGPYSHLARSTEGVLAQLVNERDEAISEGHRFMILDHDNLYPMSLGRRNPFHGCPNTPESTAEEEEGEVASNMEGFPKGGIPLN